MGVVRRDAGESSEEFRARLEREIPRDLGETPAQYHARLCAQSDLGAVEMADAAASAIAFGGVVARGAAGTVVEFFRDLFGAMFTRGASADAMQRMDEALAVADLLMLAITADGRVSDAELAALRAHHARAGLDDSAGAALEAFLARMPVPGDAAEFDRVARAAVARLQPPARREAYRAVLALAHGGSGLALASHDRAGVLVEAGALPERFAALLELSAEERAALEAESRDAR